MNVANEDFVEKVDKPKQQLTTPLLTTLQNMGFMLNHVWDLKHLCLMIYLSWMFYKHS